MVAGDEVPPCSAIVHEAVGIPRNGAVAAETAGMGSAHGMDRRATVARSTVCTRRTTAVTAGTGTAMREEGARRQEGHRGRHETDKDKTL